MFITCLDLKTYLIFKLRRDDERRDERKVHHHHFHHRRTFPSPNNSSYKQQLLLFPFEKRREIGDIWQSAHITLRSRIRPLQINKKFQN